MSERNYYDVLGLTPDADGTAVNRTYWLLARKYQGEAANDPRAHHMLDELNEAYGVLGTPVLREEYDAAQPAIRETERSSIAHDPGWSSIRETFEVRSGSTPHGDTASRPARAMSAAAPYVATIALGAASLGAGLWTGSLLLAALGAGAALASGAAMARHKILDVARVARRQHREESDPAGEPMRERFPVPKEPLSASIVRRRGVPADELRISTASMVGRWRSTVGATAGTEAIDVERGPDSTLVDIFRSEQELDSPSEPLSAVLDVLRGSRHPV